MAQGGRLILLHGASSAGKTALGRMVRAAAPRGRSALFEGA